ncbi:MAG: pyridoxal phosphate-dependent aminotransferase [Candidatus Hodarchaeota archaeon]
MNVLANRVKDIEGFIVMTVLEKAKKLERAGKNIIHFEIGEPDFDTPERVRQAAMAGCQEGKTHYTHSLGYLELRDAITSYKKKSRNIDVDPESEIMVLGGTSPGYLIVAGSLIEPGDEIVITDPGYPCYANFIKFFGGIPKLLKIHEDEKFDFNPDRLKEVVTPKTKMLILNSPANPTGQLISRKSLEKIADISIKNDLMVVSDEIYAELIYTEDKIAPSISEIPEMKERTIVLDGFSKYWAMTGWRLGYIIAPHALLPDMNKVNQNFLICAPSISQVAAIEALKCETETKEMLRKYKERRDYIHTRVNEIEGLSLVKPSGAFYAFVNIKGIQDDSLNFSLDLLEKGLVATTPGIGFGENGEGYVRFSYCTDISNIKEGMNRLETFIKDFKS